MDRRTINVYLSSILTTLDEMPGGWGPRTHIMLGCGLEYEQFLFLEDLLVQAGLVTKTSETMTITKAGREMAGKINAALAKGKR